MSRKELKEIFIQDILSSYRIHHLELSSDSPYLPDIDLQFRKQLMDSFDYQTLFFQLTEHVTVEEPVEYTDQYQLRYIISKSENNQYLFLGPFLYEPLSPSDIFDIMTINRIPTSLTADVQKYFHRITIIKDMLSWKYMITRFYSRYFDCIVSIQEINSEEHEEYKTAIRNIDLSPKSTLAYSSLEARYKVENELIRAVTAGNIADALYHYNMFMGFTLEPLLSDSIRYTKDMLIAVNTFLRKAVEAAYVHPLYIDDLNQKLTQSIESCTTDLQLNNLCAVMIRKYCLLVKSYSRAQYSELIRDCLNYIDFHYQEPLSLEMLADKFNISKGHLSTQFHKEVKMTLTDYMNSTRIRRSLLLLNTTSLSMQAIAEQCGFCDGNYFTRTFKKHQGITPLKYRQQLHQNME